MEIFDGEGHRPIINAKLNQLIHRVRLLMVLMRMRVVFVRMVNRFSEDEGGAGISRRSEPQPKNRMRPLQMRRLKKEVFAGEEVGAGTSPSLHRLFL